MDGSHDPRSPEPRLPAGPDGPLGRGPLAGSEPTGGPIDDPSLADRANPRWDDPASPQPDIRHPRTVPGEPPPDELADPDELPDPAARPLEGRDEPGSDNIREGRGGGTPNPALAEGGDHG